MAQSRLEKIGTIFTRVTGLMRSGAMKSEDKPIWYDLYEAFPPKLEPRFDRPAPNVPIRNIFYEEDVIRAKYHKSLKQQEMISLFDKNQETNSQQFIKIYSKLKSQGALVEEKIFETSAELLQEQKKQVKTDYQENSSDNNYDYKSTLSEDFNEARQAKVVENTTKVQDNEVKDHKSGLKNSIGGVSIKDLFKD